MRFRSISAVAGAFAALVAAALFAVPALARMTSTFQDNVTISNGSCKLALKSVSRANTRIIFHVVNNGSAGHAFTIHGKSTPKLKLKGETDLIVNFPGAGHWTYACTGGATHKGVFTIRTK